MHTVWAKFNPFKIRNSPFAGFGSCSLHPHCSTCSKRGRWGCLEDHLQGMGEEDENLFTGNADLTLGGGQPLVCCCWLAGRNMCSCLKGASETGQCGSTLYCWSGWLNLMCWGLPVPWITITEFWIDFCCGWISGQKLGRWTWAGLCLSWV